MNEYLLLYLFTRLDAILVFFACLALGFIALSIGCLIQYDVDGSKSWFTWTKIWFAVFLLSCSVMVVVPSQRDMAIIVGGKMALDIGRSEPVQEMAKKIYVIVNKKLDEAAK